MTDLEGITPGKITALSRTIQWVAHNPRVAGETIASHLVQNKSILNLQLARDALRLAIILGVVTDDQGVISLTKKGERFLSDSHDPSGIFLRRRLLLQIVLSLRRDLMWMAFASQEELREKDRNLAQILEELGLVRRVLTEDALVFWSELRHAGQHLDRAMLKKIGDEAEALSMEYERTRLNQNGFPLLSNRIRWLSRESDLHGYDILSFRGDGRDPNARIHIEVKKLSTRSDGSLYFHLSRNEYQQLRALDGNYFFHLWDFNNADLGAPMVVEGHQIAPRAPQDNPLGGEWSDCTIGIPKDGLRPLN